MHLPASSFAKCSAASPPSNTVFPDVSCVEVTFKDMERYLPLVLALYDLSPMGSLVMWVCFHCAHTLGPRGEFTVGLLERTFTAIDEACDGRLSQARFLRQKARWANSETWLQGGDCVIPTCPTCS